MYSRHLFSYGGDWYKPLSKRGTHARIMKHVWHAALQTNKTSPIKHANKRNDLGPGQTLFGDQTFYRLDTLFGAVWSCLYVLDRVWSWFIKFEGHQTFKQQLKTFLLCSCLTGDFLFVWTAAYQTCLMRACVPRLLSGLYQLFDPCLIKHVLTV